MINSARKFFGWRNEISIFTWNSQNWRGRQQRHERSNFFPIFPKNWTLFHFFHLDFRTWNLKNELAPKIRKLLLYNIESWFQVYKKTLVRNVGKYVKYASVCHWTGPYWFLMVLICNFQYKFIWELNLNFMDRPSLCHKMKLFSHKIDNYIHIFQILSTNSFLRWEGSAFQISSFNLKKWFLWANKFLMIINILIFNKCVEYLDVISILEIKIKVSKFYSLGTALLCLVNFSPEGLVCLCSWINFGFFVCLHVFFAKW